MMRKIRWFIGVLIGAGLCACAAVMIEHDVRIFHVVQTAIARNPEFKDSRIVVVSYNQAVLLTGQTPTASLRVLAERVAQQTPNVRHVYDEISVGAPISLAQQSKDTWITSEARSRLLATNGLDSGSLKIVTENSIVYLMGIVTKDQANLAVDVVRQIRGVQKVVKVFQYYT